MQVHKEGYRSVSIVFVFSLTVSAASFVWIPYLCISIGISVLLFFFFIFIVSFFRVPGPRKPVNPDNTLLVVSPCDGKVVAIEKINEKEYFKDERIQVSVFMSPLNVHINWFPVPGIISYARYYKGKHLVAWHPKSSELNERTSVAVKHANGKEVMFRQVAGAVARRVVTYAKEGSTVKAAEESGFIKFGSRVDIILPAGSEIKVKIGRKVRGVFDVIAELSNGK